MTTAKIVEQALEDARKGLVRGDSTGLDIAAEALGKVEAGLPDLARATPGQLQRIQRRIRRVEHLLEGLRTFHEGLARISTVVDDAVANYTRGGTAESPTDPDRSVNLHG